MQSSFLFLHFPREKTIYPQANRFSVLKNCCITSYLYFSFPLFTSNQSHPYCFLSSHCLMLNPVKAGFIEHGPVHMWEISFTILDNGMVQIRIRKIQPAKLV